MVLSTISKSIRGIMYKLEDIPMFSHLPRPYFSMLNDKLFVKKYTKGSIVFYEGDRSDYMYIVLEGSVKMYKTTPKGNQIHINTLQAPSLIGEYACFEQQPFPATCEFESNGVMGMLPFATIMELLNNRDFSYEIIKSLTGKVMLLSTLVHKETVLSSEAKVADILIHKPNIFKRLKNSEIASILNLTPETFSRILAKFKKEKIITLTNHQLDILDRDKLFVILETNKIKECSNCILSFKEKIGYKEEG